MDGIILVLGSQGQVTAGGICHNHKVAAGGQLLQGGDLLIDIAGGLGLLHRVVDGLDFTLDALQHRHCLQGTVLGDDGLVVLGVQRAARGGLAAVQGVVDGGPRGGAGQGDLSAAGHLAPLGLGLGGGHGHGFVYLLCLVEGELIGIPIGISFHCSGLIGPELVLTASIAGQIDRIVSLARKDKHSILKAPAPGVFPLLDTVVIATLRGDISAVLILKRDGIAVHGQCPEGIALRGLLSHGSHPAFVQYTGGIAGVCNHVIGACGELLRRSDLGVGGLLLGAGHHRQQAQTQHQGHQQRQGPGGKVSGSYMHILLVPFLVSKSKINVWIYVELRRPGPSDRR